jgi:hypothetical protein
MPTPVPFTRSISVPPLETETASVVVFNLPERCVVLALVSF